MATIKTLAAGVSPYPAVAAEPTVLVTTANGRPSTVAAASAVGVGTTVVVNGQAALNNLITTNQSGVFDGANVTINLEEQNFNTTNQVTSTTNYADGANGSIQYNNGSNGFAGDAYFTFTNSNVVTPGIRTNGYFYGNGAPFTGGGNAAIGNFVFSGDVMTISDANQVMSITGNGIGNIRVTSNGNIWTFNNVGNLILPSNTSGINYANGSPYGVGNYSNANVSSFMAAFGSNVVSTTGNITGNFFIGNGSLLTGVVSSYGNANVVANLAALGANPVSTTGIITAEYFIGNGSQLTGIVQSYGNANVVANLAALGANPVSTTGNITAASINANLYTAPGNVVITASNNTWTFGDGGSLVFPSGLNIIKESSNTRILTNTGRLRITATNNAYINIGWDQFSGTGPVAKIYANGIDTGQPSNVVIKTGNFAATTYDWVFGNTGNLAAPGRISATNIVTNSIASDDSSFVTIEDGVNVNGEIAATGNISAGNINLPATGQFFIGTAGLNSVSIQPETITVISGTGTGQVFADYFIGDGSNLSGIEGANVTGNVANAIYAISAGTVTTNAQPNITSVGILTSLSSLGNITAGNLDAVNLVINSIRSDDSTFVTIEDGVNVNGEISATGNITGGNINTGGKILGNYIFAQSGATSAYATKRVLQYVEGTGVVTYSNYIDASSIYITGYAIEIHVSPSALDDSGNGTIGTPVKTIARAQVLAAEAFETSAPGQRKTIVLHPGDYAENVTISTQFTVLTTHELVGKNTTLSGTLTITKGCTIDGLKMTNLVISADNTTGSVDIIGCTVTTAVTKTSSAYTNFRGCDISSATLSITGTGSTVLVGGNYFTLTVNNAAAGVLAKSVVSMGPVTLTAGTLQLADTLIYALANTGNAITQSAGSVITVNNCQTLIPDLTNVARNSFGGFYSILNAVYDKANSTFAGTSLSSILYSQNINADALTLAATTLSTSTATGALIVAGGAGIGGNVYVGNNITGGNVLTGGLISATGNVTANNGMFTTIVNTASFTGGLVSVTGNITGNYFIGNGSQLTSVAVPSQTILPTIQSITAVARSAGLFGGGQGGANVTVANTIPVTEYGVIITAGTISETYKTGALGSIPGTVSLTFTTDLDSTQYTLFAYVTSNAGTYYSNAVTGTSGICLLAGTQIALSDGTHKAIEHITYTDKLLSWDFDRGCYAETTAMWIKRSETGSQYNLLTFSDGTTLRTFDQHRIFNKQAGAFTYPMTAATPVGTVTVNEHGQEITLTNKQVIRDTIEYYNVITDYHMNLFSDSVLTSCRFNNIYPIVDMKFAKDGRTPRSRAEFKNVPDRFFHGLRLAEQTVGIETVEWYVNRLLSTEVSTHAELAV